MLGTFPFKSSVTLRRSKTRRGAFTIAELMVACGIMAAAATVCIPSWQHFSRKQRGMTCGSNLRVIQAAKHAALSDDPNATLTTELVSHYLPNGIVPACPSGGNYDGIEDATVMVGCSLNGDTAADDQSNGSIDVMMNGSHDAYLPNGQLNTVRGGTIRPPIKGPILH